MTKPKPKPATKAAAPKKGMNTGRKPAAPARPPAKPAANFLPPPKKGKEPEPERELTPKQATFVREYLVDLNATAAAKRAGYSPRTAGEQAARLLANVRIRLHIDAAMAARAERTEITAERVLKELARIGFSDSRKVMSWSATGVKFKDSAELDDDSAAIVSEVKETASLAGMSMGMKLHDKVKALELIGKHLGMFVDKTELTGKNGKPLLPSSTHATGVLLVPGVLSTEDWLRLAAEPDPAPARPPEGD